MTNIASTEAIAAADAPARASVALRGLLRQPLAVAALLIVFVITTACVLAEFTAPYDPLQQDLDNLLSWPSAEHLLGTDALGRDTLSRLLYGGRPTLAGVAIAIAVFLVIGVTLGLIAGFVGGVVDRAIGTLVDVMLSLPGIILVFAVLAIFSQNIFAAMITFGFLVSASLIRVVRAAVLTTREELYVRAAVVSGLSPSRIMFRHVLPGLVGPITVQVSLFAGAAIGIQTGLGFLGLASPPPAPSWGGMVGEAADALGQTPMLLLASGGTIAFMTVSFALIGEGIRDADNDRRRGRIRAQQHRAPESPVWETPEAGLQLQALSISRSTAGQGGKALVDDVSLSVASGEIVGLVGESGSGKTLTSLSLLGLLPDGLHVSGGAARLGPDLLTNRSSSEWRTIRGRRIAMVSQEPMTALNPLFTVGSHLDDTLRALTDLGKAQRKERAAQLLAAVRLPDPQLIFRRYPHELSGGMIQRVVIAIALAGDPELLIADEPTTALDVTVQAEILDLLRRLRDERGLSIILVTHDLGVVADLCDRAVVLREGRVIETATVEQLFANPQAEYTRQLIARTPSLVEVNHAG